ncbi:MBL fold metallo-hydrolase [Alteribacter salitolerans]|uniref:MBL fold metallo-hydrolase n=1 Tax=Alteribacter salitolerans TaxID=2912333 RepID=UPI001F34D234|nr:MBL fold metallo-hydrolase [Alteribacter salitolerans]
MLQHILTLDKDRYLIDGFDLGMAERTGSYVLAERDLTLIETGPSLSVPFIKEGLSHLGFESKDIKNIIVTHIHLDHSGGLGLLLQECPYATVYVHKKGARHLCEPRRLIQGAKMVYKDEFDRLFDPVLPVDPDVIKVARHNSTLSIGRDAALTFFETPGHANHHIGIFDEKSGIFFSGDTLGVIYPSLKRTGIELVLPSTSPNQFDPDCMLASMELVQKVGPRRIAFGHFGLGEDPGAVYSQITYWLPLFMETGHEHFLQDGTHEQLKDALFSKVKEYLQNFTDDIPDEAYKSIELDLLIGSMGILDYYKRKSRQ